MKELCIISLSGGIDSFATTYKALEEGKDVFLITFYYKQKHLVELHSANNIVNYLKNSRYKDQIIGHKVIHLDDLFSEFLDIYVSLREDNTIKEKSEHKYYVPSRNLLFAVMSLVIGEIITISKDYDKVSIGLGIHKHTKRAYGQNRTNYWDITIEFAHRLKELISLNNVINTDIYTPFVDKYKKDILKYVKDKNLPYKLTWTCYSPIYVRINDCYKPCKECEACIEREYAGKEVNIIDINDYEICINSEV